MLTQKLRQVKVFPAGVGAGAADAGAEAVQSFSRQALHAAVLGFEHPVSGEFMRFDAKIPDDMDQLLQVLR